MGYSKNPEFWLASTMFLVTGMLMVGTYLRLLPLNFTVGPYRFAHWLSWIGYFFIAAYTPAFHVLRRLYPERTMAMIRVHVFGYLFSFMLVSTHFAQQMSRSVHPEDRTGLTSYIIVCILVVTGFLHRFQILEKGRVYPPHRNRFLHVSVTMAFYIVVSIHILHTLRFL